jgi:signal transduction histidine kinase
MATSLIRLAPRCTCISVPWFGLVLLLLVIVLPAPASAQAPAASGEALVAALRSGTLEAVDHGGVTVIAALPFAQLLAQRRNRQFRLTLPFDLPNPAAAALWAVYFQALYEGGQIYVNGSLAGAAPTSSAHTAALNVRPYLFTVPPALLRAGRNHVEVRWVTHNTYQHLAPAFIGPYDVVRPAYERRLFWQNTMAQVSCSSALICAALLLGVYVIRRERRYLLMGLASLGWASICAHYFLPAMPVALYPWVQFLRITCIAMLSCCSWLFFALESAVPHRRYLYLCTGWAVLGPASFLIDFALHDSIFHFATEGVWAGVMVLLGLWSLALLLRAQLRRWDWRRAVFLAVGVVGMMAGGADIAMTATGTSDHLFGGAGYSVQATAPAWFTAIVVVLLKDFGDFLSQRRTQRLEMQQRLREQERQLQALHKKAQQRETERVAHEERQRIMQDMHDGLGSQLVSSLVLSERGALDATQTSTLLRECIDDLRLAIDSLAAGVDSFAAMAGNLRFRMEPRLRAAGITLKWNSLRLADSPAPTPAQTLPLLRILQEGLSNALKHAQASEVTVTIETVAEGLRVCVADNGVGFELGDVSPGKGLHGMEKRARTLGAQLTVQQSAQGTTLVLLLPLRAPRDANSDRAVRASML